MMVDLALNVRTVAAKEYADRETMLESHRQLVAKVYRAKRTNHILSVLLAALALASCTVLCWPHLMSDYNQSVTFSITTTVFYTFVALLLMWSLIKLLLTFRMQGLPGELVAELNKIIVFLIYYSVAFATRAIAVTLVFVHEWPQFNRYW